MPVSARLWARHPGLHSGPGSSIEAPFSGHYRRPCSVLLSWRSDFGDRLAKRLRIGAQIGRAGASADEKWRRSRILQHVVQGSEIGLQRVQQRDIVRVSMMQGVD